MLFVDSHLHLPKTHQDAFIQGILSQNIVPFLQSTDKDSITDLIALSYNYNFPYFVGFHPWYLDRVNLDENILNHKDGKNLATAIYDYLDKILVANLKVKDTEKENILYFANNSLVNNKTRTLKEHLVCNALNGFNQLTVSKLNKPATNKSEGVSTNSCTHASAQVTDICPPVSVKDSVNTLADDRAVTLAHDRISLPEHNLTKPSFCKDHLAGVGECGLDHKAPLPIAVQIEVLKAHLDLAYKYKLPVSLHCVGAHNELIKLLKNYYSRSKLTHCALHGTLVHKDLYLKYSEYDLYFGIGKFIRLTNAQDDMTLQCVSNLCDRLVPINKKVIFLLENAPLKRLLCESDFDKDREYQYYDLSFAISALSFYRKLVFSDTCNILERNSKEFLQV